MSLSAGKLDTEQGLFNLPGTINGVVTGREYIRLQSASDNCDRALYVLLDTNTHAIISSALRGCVSPGVLPLDLLTKYGVKLS